MRYGRVFADTYFYVALLHSNDAGHEFALEISEECDIIVTTEFVLMEVGNAFKKSASRRNFSSLMTSIFNDPQNLIVPASTVFLKNSLALFARHEDKEWSLTDCSSFVVMRDLGLTQALTADHHFSQAGFVALLRRSL